VAAVDGPHAKMLAIVGEHRVAVLADTRTRALCNLGAGEFTSA
jgi:hypothetical protein